MYRIAPGYEIFWSTKFGKSIHRCRKVLSWVGDRVSGIVVRPGFPSFSEYKLG